MKNKTIYFAIIFVLFVSLGIFGLQKDNIAKAETVSNGITRFENIKIFVQNIINKVFIAVQYPTTPAIALIAPLPNEDGGGGGGGDGGGTTVSTETISFKDGLFHTVNFTVSLDKTRYMVGETAKATVSISPLDNYCDGIAFFNGKVTIAGKEYYVFREEVLVTCESPKVLDDIPVETTPGNYSATFAITKFIYIAWFTSTNTKEVSIPYTVYGPAPTASISADSTNISYKTATTIRWSSTNATSCTVSPSGWTGTSGAQGTGNLTSSQTYTVGCCNVTNDCVSDSVTVNILPLTASISADSTSVAYNTGTTIRWSSTSATACVISYPGNSNWASGTSGSKSTGNLTSSQTYTVNCTTLGGSAYCSGNYTDTNVKVNWEGSGSTDTSCIHWTVDDWVRKTSSWVEGVYYGYNPDGSAGGCSKCKDRENTGYVVSSSNWYNSDCNGDYFLGICTGAHWVKGTYIRSGYLTGSCANFSQSCCSSYSSCTWNPSEIGGSVTKSVTVSVSAVPTCSDNIKNQGETGVDCGGPCPPCPTCSDNIKNQGETGVDCGGPCPSCPKPIIKEVAP